MPRDIPLPHPGTIRKEEFLDPTGVTVYALAKAIEVSRSRVNDICGGRQGISAAIVLRLGRFFDVDPRWFLNVQSQYDLAESEEGLADALARIEPHGAAA